MRTGGIRGRRFQFRDAEGIRSQPYQGFTPEMRRATLVVDAVLGTGLSGPAQGAELDAILEINSSFPLAAVIAVDYALRIVGDSGAPPPAVVRSRRFDRNLYPSRRFVTRCLRLAVLWVNLG